jgi:hypothetical protein
LHQTLDILILASESFHAFLGEDELINVFFEGYSIRSEFHMWQEGRSSVAGLGGVTLVFIHEMFRNGVTPGFSEGRFQLGNRSNGVVKEGNTNKNVDEPRNLPAFFRHGGSGRRLEVKDSEHAFQVGLRESLLEAYEGMSV